MTQISDPHIKIKALARRLHRRLQALGARRDALSDAEVEQLVVDIGLDRAWRAVDKLTAPQPAAPVE
jgi:hypothetical protein